MKTVEGPLTRGGPSTDLPGSPSACVAGASRTRNVSENPTAEPPGTHETPPGPLWECQAAASIPAASTQNNLPL